MPGISFLASICIRRFKVLFIIILCLPARVCVSHSVHIKSSSIQKGNFSYFTHQACQIKGYALTAASTRKFFISLIHGWLLLLWIFVGHIAGNHLSTNILSVSVFLQKDTVFKNSFHFCFLDLQRWTVKSGHCWLTRKG